MSIPKHANDDGRVLKHEDGTDFDDELRFVHFDYLQNKYVQEVKHFNIIMCLYTPLYPGY